MPEGLKGPRATDFVSQLIQDMLSAYQVALPTLELSWNILVCSCQGWDLHASQLGRCQCWGGILYPTPITSIFFFIEFSFLLSLFFYILCVSDFCRLSIAVISVCLFTRLMVCRLPPPNGLAQVNSRFR